MGPLLFPTVSMGMSQVMDSAEDGCGLGRGWRVGLEVVDCPLGTNSVTEFILCFTKLSRQLSKQGPIVRAKRAN